MNIPVDKEWFRKRLEGKGLTLRKTAGLIGMDPAALSRTLNGERKMKLPEVGKIATVLGVTSAEVLARMDADAASTGAQVTKPVRRIGDHPAFGFMKGLIKVEKGFDLTGPSGDDEDWDGYLGEDRLG